jgi:hypothetical protein
MNRSYLAQVFSINRLFCCIHLSAP